MELSLRRHCRPGTRLSHRFVSTYLDSELVIGHLGIDKEQERLGQDCALGVGHQFLHVFIPDFDRVLIDDLAGLVQTDHAFLGVDLAVEPLHLLCVVEVDLSDGAVFLLGEGDTETGLDADV